MRRTRWVGLASLLGLMGLVFTAQAQLTTKEKAAREGEAREARVYGPGVPRSESFRKRLAKATKLKEADVQKVLQEIGPAIREQLVTGQQVDLPGLGTIRIVRIAERKDLVDGRPRTIPASNVIDFVPSAE